MSTPWNYQVVREHCHHPDLGWYFTYGICILQDTPENTPPVIQVHDITTEHARALSLAQQFTRCQVSPLHLKEVLEDALP